MRILKITYFIILLALSKYSFTEGGKHLFILSGQSNMARLDPAISFTPAIEERLGKNNVIVVQHSMSGRPIRRWYKDWRSADGSWMNLRGPYMEVIGENGGIFIRVMKQLINGEEINPNGEHYEVLMERVFQAIEKESLRSVTFVWMHGERDARESYGDVYEASLAGLLKQLNKDLGRNDANFVIGRISDWDINNALYPHWTMVREAQVRYAEKTPKAEWVNTDDLNSGLSDEGAMYENDIHYSAEGYRLFGKRLAESSIKLLIMHGQLASNVALTEQCQEKAKQTQANP